MKLIEAYQVVQLVIAKELLNLLHYDGEKSLQEWAEKHKDDAEKLNELVLAVLANNRQQILDALTAEYAEAEKLIKEHIEEEWGFVDIEIDSFPNAEATAQYLNEYVIRSLYSTIYQTGTVERTFQGILKQVKETEIENSSEISTALGAILYERLQNGFYSGFIQSDGLRWRMDRYVQQISKHIYQDTYTRVLRDVLYGKGVELVQVEKFVKPREACAELQASGIICIVPRHEASEEALSYPNIWDEDHYYLEPAGHHGIHCRHLWHSLESQKSGTKKLYDIIDKNMMRLEVHRLLFNKMLRKYI